MQSYFTINGIKTKLQKKDQIKYSKIDGKFQIIRTFPGGIHQAIAKEEISDDGKRTTEFSVNLGPFSQNRQLDENVVVSLIMAAANEGGIGKHYRKIRDSKYVVIFEIV
jgi:hypothetical protein